VRRILTALLFLCVVPLPAFAQTNSDALDISAAEQASQGPMTVERVHNGFLAAPEFKFTEVDKRSAGLVGGYAGVVVDEHFFVGGGAYVLATQRRGRDMAYGGLVLQWLSGGNDTFGFSAKTLLGGGSAESSGTIQVFNRGRAIVEPFRSRRNFLVAEPELDALVRISDHLRLSVGAGYRFTGSDWGRRDGTFDSTVGRLSGAVGTVSLHIVGGS
jgi:hypothetical protein